MRSRQLPVFGIVGSLAVAAWLGVEPTPAVGAVLTPTVYYDLSGDGLKVSYVPLGEDGQAHFTLEDGTGTVSFAGAEIRTVDQTDVGRLVSVTTRRTVDSGSTTFTIFIPRVVLDAPDAPAPIQVPGMFTTHRFSIIPRLNRGQLDVYSPVMLTGAARTSVL